MYNRKFWAPFTIVVFTAFLVIPIVWEGPRNWILTLGHTHPWWGGGLFVLLLAIGTIAAPISTLPLVPVASIIFGPITTAFLSILGWGIGSLGVFLLARHLGKPILDRFISLERVSNYEKRVSERAVFWWVVFLRMVTPVDFLSYALGLTSSMKTGPYALATLIGITPFAFVFAYLGEAVASKQYLLSIVLTSGVLLVVGIGYLLGKGKRG
jgi:uncharacterized membrane protein YdjX (TVP38/TMEM64 family)